MARKLGKRKLDAFCRVLADTGNVTKAAAAIGRNRGDLYVIKDANPEFANRWRLAIEEYVDSEVQDSVLAAAVEGYVVMEETRGPDGKVIKQKAVKRKDPRLGLKVLERRHPDYKPKTEIDGAGVSGVLIVPGLANSQEEFDAEFGIE